MNISASNYRVQEFFDTSKAAGTYVFTEDGSANSDNVAALQDYLKPDGTIEANLPPGELNRYGGEHDLTAW